MNQQHIDISFVVIGRNEAENLPHLAQQLSSLHIGKATELIFVDSGSRDRSVNIAKQYFDIVVQLEESPKLSASAGRYVGTEHATGDWVLYLDGDMRLHPDFISFLGRIALQDLQHGIVGKHHIVDSFKEMDFNIPGIVEQDVDITGQFVPARNIPGTLLIRRQQIMECGNWNPGIFGNEEDELLSRLRMYGISVHKMDVAMVAYEKNTGPMFTALLGYFTPFGHRGKRFYGFGQVLRSLTSLEHAKSYVTINPYPFLFLLVIVALLLSIMCNIVFWLVLPIAAVLSYTIIINKGKRFLVAYLGFPIRAVTGWLVYDKRFRPRIISVVKKKVPDIGVRSD